MRVRNWQKFQHFKDRRPPWIKLYREILDQRDINLISDCSFRVLVGCWLLASEDETQQGLLPPIDDMAFRLRIEKKKLINALAELEPWLYRDDINVISERYQLDAPETETETETEHPPLPPKGGREVPSGFAEFWSAYPRKVGKGAAEKAFSKAPINGHLSDVLDALEAQKRSEQWRRDGGQFIPNPATWLNQRRWEDGEPPAKQDWI